MASPELSPKIISQIEEILESDKSTEYNNVESLDEQLIEGVMTTITPNGDNYWDYSVGHID